MGLWSKGLERAQSGELRLEDNKIIEIKEFLEGRNGIRKYDLVDLKHGIIDIEGDLEISTQDLFNGKIPVKIRRLSGDLIITTNKIHPSVIPDEIGGNIILGFSNF